MNDHAAGNMEALLTEIRGLQPSISRSITSILEERAIGAGTVTYDGLKEMLAGLFRDQGVAELVAAARNPLAPQEAQGEIPLVPVELHVFLWEDGSRHNLPEEFIVPTCNLSIAWQLWCCGIGNQQIPPLKSVSLYDISTAPKKKIFSNYKSVMDKFQAKSIVKGTWFPVMDMMQVNAAFISILDVIEIPVKTGQDRHRRISEMKWSTALNVIRKQLKGLAAIAPIAPIDEAPE
jgi:hypothetical protein